MFVKNVLDGVNEGLSECHYVRRAAFSSGLLGVGAGEGGGLCSCGVRLWFGGGAVGLIKQCVRVW